MDTNHDLYLQQCIIVHLSIIFSIMICMVTSLIETSGTRKAPKPYHTSALSGEAWVIELLIGHPDQIRCELGVRAHIFVKLVDKLREFKHKDSRFVSLEEQLSIFLLWPGII